MEHAYTNCYLISDDTGVTLVDAAFPSTARAVLELLAAIGRAPADIRALLLTHGHFDHVGFARGLQRALHVPVWVHVDDQNLAAHPYRYRPERNRLLYPSTHRRSWPVLGQMLLAGALSVHGVQADHILRDMEELDVPGQPVVVHTPGHTAGECAFWLPERRVVLSGDALVTLDPYTGALGPRLVAPAATADSAQALTSLGRLADLDADVVLPGHGAAWRKDIRQAVSLARRATARAAGTEI